MNEKNVIIVYGGSFNPPLYSHFSEAEQVLNQFENAEKVVFVPVNKSYPKDGLEENIHRYNMLKLVIDKNERFLLSDIDVKDSSKSLYTIETLEIIQNEFPEKKIWFLIGSDNLKELHTWKRAEELLSNYTVLVMERKQDIAYEIIKTNEFLLKHKDNIKIVNSELRNNLSSTFVREQLKNGKSVKYLMPDEVFEYIKKNNLYMG